MRRSLEVTGPVLAALSLVVVVEAVATHLILRDSSALTHALLAAMHLSIVAWLVVRFARR
jgi:hypothetical protein